MENLNNEDWNQMISQICYEKEQVKTDYEGFVIISEQLDNKMSKADLILALDIMWKIVMEADKATRDEQYLFGKGLIQFNEAVKDKIKSSDFTMTNEQQTKLKTKINNIKPLINFLLKMKDVIK